MGNVCALLDQCILNTRTQELPPSKNGVTLLESMGEPSSDSEGKKKQGDCPETPMSATKEKWGRGSSFG